MVNWGFSAGDFDDSYHVDARPGRYRVRADARLDKRSEVEAVRFIFPQDPDLSGHPISTWLLADLLTIVGRVTDLLNRFVIYNYDAAGNLESTRLFSGVTSSFGMRWPAVLAILLVACANPSPPAAAPMRSVFIIVMENHSADEALTGPYTASLAARYRMADNYHAVARPSVPNYLALTSGSTWGVRDDSYRVLPKQDLGMQLTRAGISWRAYMEGLTDAGCLRSPLPYDPGHNPFAFYGGGCPSNVVSFTSFGSDMAGPTPRFVWITPDRCHDTHDCSVATGDDWLRQVVSQITGSAAWKANGVLFITWDEDDGSADNRVLTLVIQPGKSHRTSNRMYTHYSLLATFEDLLGVGRLGQAAQATAMSDLVG